MKLEEAISLRIKDLCNERNITTNKLASMAGLPSASIRFIFYGKNKSPGTRLLLDICQALGITLFDFFNDKIFKDKFLEGSYK